MAFRLDSRSCSGSNRLTTIKLLPWSSFGAASAFGSVVELRRGPTIVLSAASCRIESIFHRMLQFDRGMDRCYAKEAQSTLHNDVFDFHLIHVASICRAFLIFQVT